MGCAPARAKETALTREARTAAVRQFHGRLGLEHVNHPLLVGPHNVRADEPHVGRGGSALERHLLLLPHKFFLFFFIVVIVVLNITVQSNNQRVRSIHKHAKAKPKVE
jgi:hypothetical protein